MAQTTMKIGILSREEYRKRTMAIARGEYKPSKDEPKIWFESLQSMAQVLSNENRELLRTILKRNPDSIKDLEMATGRKSGNLSRTLKMMERYGIVRLKRHSRKVKPIVQATDFKVEFGLGAKFP